MEELKFKTKTGYCEIFPEKIVLTRNGAVGALADAVGGKKSIVRILVIHTISILFWLFLMGFAVLAAFANLAFGQIGVAIILFVCAFFLLGFSLFGIVGVVSSFNNSVTPVIDRKSIQKVIFHKAIPFFTRAYFVVKFTDENGKIKNRIIMLPGSMSGGKEETQKAFGVMKQSGLLNK